MKRLGFAADVELSVAEIHQATSELTRQAEEIAEAVAAGNISREASDELFTTVDIDGDDQLTQKEIKKGLEEIQASTGLAGKAKGIFKDADTSGDKKIDREEFFAYMKTTWDTPEGTEGAAGIINVEALTAWLASQSTVAEKIRFSSPLGAFVRTALAKKNRADRRNKKGLRKKKGGDLVAKAEEYWEELDTTVAGLIETEKLRDLPRVFDVPIGIEPLVRQLDPKGVGKVLEDTFIQWYCSSEVPNLVKDYTEYRGLWTDVMKQIYPVGQGDEMPLGELDEGLLAYGISVDDIETIKKDMKSIVSRGDGKPKAKGLEVYAKTDDFVQWQRAESLLCDPVKKLLQKGPSVKVEAKEKKSIRQKLKRETLTQSAKRELKVFKELDVSGDGLISSAEFHDVVGLLGVELDALELEELDEEFGDEIDFDQFSEWLNSQTLVSTRVKKQVYAISMKGGRIKRADGLKGKIKSITNKAGKLNVLKKAVVGEDIAEELRNALMTIDGEARLVFDMFEINETGEVQITAIGPGGNVALSTLVGTELAREDIEDAMDELALIVEERTGNESTDYFKWEDFIGWLKSESSVAIKIVDSMAVRMTAMSSKPAGSIYVRVCKHMSNDTVRACKVVHSGKWYYEVQIGDTQPQKLGFAHTDFNIAGGSGKGVGDSENQKIKKSMAISSKDNMLASMMGTSTDLIAKSQDSSADGARPSIPLRQAHLQSWAFDGSNGQKWTGGVSSPYSGKESMVTSYAQEDAHVPHDSSHDSNVGAPIAQDFGAPKVATGWSHGDVVGCLLDLDSGEISFTLNGKDLGVAFEDVDPENGICPAATLVDGPHIFTWAVEDMRYLPAGYKSFTLALDSQDFSLLALTSEDLREEAMRRGQAWLPSEDFDAYDLVGEAIYVQDVGIGTVLAYSAGIQKSGRGHTIRFDDGEVKMSLASKGTYTVMNSDYINSFVKNQFEQRKTETESKEQERLAQGRTMLLVAEEMIRRKTHAERHGDTSVTQPLQDDDFVQLFAELDKYGESEVMTEPENFKRLFEAVGDRLHDNKMEVIMEEIAGALQMPEWWKGQMSLESLRTWIESDPKVAPLGARLNESAMRFKEDELLRALFDEIDRDGSGDLDVTEMRRLGDVTHINLTAAECNQAIAEIDIDGDGSLCFEEFELWFYGPSKIANKIKERSVAAAEMDSRESKVMLRVEDGDNVKIQGKVVTEATFETVRACKAVTGGKWYYEVMIGDRTNGQIGFARSDFQCKSADGNGVGDPLSSGQSWGYDGCGQLKLNHGATPYPDGTTPEEGNGWSTGDIVGCFLDLDAGEISFALNGVNLGVAFKGVRATNKLKIFPCATLNDGPHLFKFSSTECKYADRYKEHRVRSSFLYT
jgi:Ca2+-binding EF-hand superfamily protein